MWSYTHCPGRLVHQWSHISELQNEGGRRAFLAWKAETCDQEHRTRPGYYYFIRELWWFPKCQNNDKYSLSVSGWAFLNMDIDRRGAVWSWGSRPDSERITNHSLCHPKHYPILSRGCWLTQWRLSQAQSTGHWRSPDWGFLGLTCIPKIQNKKRLVDFSKLQKFWSNMVVLFKVITVP